MIKEKLINYVKHLAPLPSERLLPGDVTVINNRKSQRDLILESVNQSDVRELCVVSGSIRYRLRLVPYFDANLQDNNTKQLFSVEVEVDGLLVQENHFSVYDDALFHFGEIKTSLLRRKTDKPTFFNHVGVWVLALLLVLGGSFLGGLKSTQEGTVASSASSGPIYAPVAPADLVAPNKIEDSTASKAEMDAVSRLAGVVATGKSATRFYVFTDPNCPYCKQMESSVEAVAAKGEFSAVVIPLGYKPGSRDVAASVLCSKDASKAWSDWMIKDVKPTAAPCAAGYQLIDKNMEVFESMRLSGTPVTITPAGLILAGSVKAEDLERALKGSLNGPKSATP
jgi:hypothetical protein